MRNLVLKLIVIKYTISLNLIIKLEFLKKVFNLYTMEKKGEKSMSLRLLLKFAQDFELYNKIQNFNKSKLEVSFANHCPSKQTNFKNFLEILFKISKNLKKNEQIPHDVLFKILIEEVIYPKYNEIYIKLYEFNIDKIQITHESFDIDKNPTVGLLFNNDDLIKHVFLIL